MSGDRDPYHVLGVRPDASEADIRAAYVARARQAHPDVVGASGLELMRALNEAWALLKDPDRRAAYDEGHGHRLNRGQPTGTAGGSPNAGAATPQASSPTAANSREPAWTGAAGKAPGRPIGSVLGFGIYAGWSLGEIARRDKGYLTWLRDRPDGKRYVKEITTLLDQLREEPGAARRDARQDRKRR